MLKPIFVALLTAGLMYGPPLVMASTPDLRATTVPAAVCTPVDSTQASMVTLVNAAWVFRGANIGTVNFYCPLSRNTFTMSNATNNNQISGYRVYYRDSDGTGAAARVTTRLLYRRGDGLYGAGNTWSSSVHNISGNTTRNISNPHNLQADALYSFLVTLQRTNIQQEPAFSGIDFTLVLP